MKMMGERMTIFEQCLGHEPFPVEKAFKFAKEFYDEKTYQHAMRVAGYISQDMTIPKALRQDCICLAIMHDLLEDTDIDPESIKDNFPRFYNALKLLTKDKKESYVEYCKKISAKEATTPWHLCAHWVKLADMKDHLNLKDTLTDRLKNKYLEGLAELL